MVDDPEKLGVYGRLSASGRTTVVLTVTTVVKSFMRLLLSTFRRRRCAEARLLQSTLENIGEGLSVFDSRGRLIAWNSRFCELLELPPDLPVGAPLRDILMLQAARGDFGRDDPSAEVAKRLEWFYRDVPTTKERVTPRGRILQISRRAMPDGAIVSVYSDVTDLKASERKLIQARSQAEMANHAKSEFLANMSHELRTPLNAIIGFSEIIAHELFGPLGNEKYLDYMKDIHQSSLHLLSIINDVLDMSKIEAGKLELSKEPLNIRHLIGEVVRMMRERADEPRYRARDEAVGWGGGDLGRRARNEANISQPSVQCDKILAETGARSAFASCRTSPTSPSWNSRIMVSA